MREMKKPNFFVIGAVKAGTTSLYHYLDQHLDVYMSPIKEPHYFSKDIRCDDFSSTNKNKLRCPDMKKYLAHSVLKKMHIAHIDNYGDYLGLFRDVKNERAIGEISNGYFYSKSAAKEIHKEIPNAKIIAVLRDPIKRAFSQWIMNIREGRAEKNTFVDSVLFDYDLEKKGWMQSSLYIENGLYFEMLQRYFEVFPRENIKIMIFEDMKKDPKSFYEEILSFLQLEPESNIDLNQKFNEAGIGRNKVVNIITQNNILRFVARNFPPNIKEKLKKILYTKRGLPKLTEDDRARLISFFENDIKNLEHLIGRDLSSWLSIDI